MAKKCIPGVICVENMTLFLLFVILVLVVYFYYRHFSNPPKNHTEPSKVIIVAPPTLGAVATRQDPMNNPYAPPMKSDSLYYPPNFGDVRGAIPVNIETRGLSTSYQQVGILTRVSGSKDMILPLMGRRNMAGRDKWQYYTISNTGNLNTKLPVSVNGKSCTSEYGCDNINNGDIVYVEGYNDTFRATVYETSTFQYIPQL
jgi:Family of unknown function (DUF5755)